jgi:rare lipoprotein A
MLKLPNIGRSIFLLTGLFSCWFEGQSAAKLHQQGFASYYSTVFHGRRTANGERYNQNHLTAAHPSLPFGHMVKVVNSKTGQDVIVRINDRGPFHHKRIIDVSRAAATVLGMLTTGTTWVKLEIVGTNGQMEVDSLVQPQPLTQVDFGQVAQKGTKQAGSSLNTSETASVGPERNAAQQAESPTATKSVMHQADQPHQHPVPTVPRTTTSSDSMVLTDRKALRRLMVQLRDMTKTGNPKTSTFHFLSGKPSFGAFWGLQVGAFHDFEHVIDIAQQLLDAGQQTIFLQLVNTNDQSYYRVLVGAYPNFDKAQSQIELLNRTGFHHSYPVVHR